MQPVADMLAMPDEVGIDAVRARSEQLTAYAIERFDDELSPLGVQLAMARDPARRGSHVTLDHPAFEAIVAAPQRRGPSVDPMARGSGCRRSARP